MQTNKFDKVFADKLKDRELTPSLSAWERLETKLDETPVLHKMKNKIYKFVGYAATIALLVSSFLWKFDVAKESTEPSVDIIVEVPSHSKENEIHVSTKINTQEVVNNEKRNLVMVKPLPKKKVNKLHQNTDEKIISKKNTVALVDEPNNTSELNNLKTKVKVAEKGIKVDADYLLFAVTHSREEVKAYYAKYQINRNDVLDTIKKQLIKSNLKVDAETILAEVENDIEEEDFQQNFMQTIKGKLSNVLVAFAERNN